MTNGTKILIVIIIIAAIITGIIVVTSNGKKHIENIEEKEENIFQVLEENILDEEDNDNNYKENNIIKNNTNQTNNQTKNLVSNTAITTTQVTGREEQESKTENTEVDNEKIALELAKKEWGIDVNSYDYEAKLKSDGIYEVTVRERNGNRNSIAIYTVNIKTGAVTDKIQ